MQQIWFLLRVFSVFLHKATGSSKQIGSDILISLQLHKPHCICVRLWIPPLTSNIKCNITIIFTSNRRLENVTGQVLWRILRCQLSRVSIFSFLFLFIWCFFFKDNISWFQQGYFNHYSTEVPYCVVTRCEQQKPLVNLASKFKHSNKFEILPL